MLTERLDSSITEAGCDEAGRGSLVGPVYAAAVIFPKGLVSLELNDSKKLSRRKRDQLREWIEREAVAYAVAYASREEIEKINILNASILAMHRALENLKVLPEIILVDGNRFKSFRNIQHTCIVKGDGIFMSIAAASILAKTYRDEYMDTLHAEFPEYGWNTNRGYATARHLEAIRAHGLSPHHRKTFLANIQTRLYFEI